MIERTAWWNLLKQPDTPTSPHIGILGLPFDGGVCYRKGAAQAPAKLRELSRTASAITESGQSFERLCVIDLGDVLPVGEEAELPHLYFERVAAKLDALPSLPFLLCLGGDHSTLIPVARWLQKRDNSAWGIVHIDAHPDLFSIYEKSPLSHACALRRTLELPNFHPGHCVLVAARSFSSFELDFIRTTKMHMVTAKDFPIRGALTVADEVCRCLEGLEHVLVSLDIDAVDPAFAPGTGIPVAAGLSSRDLLSLIETCMQRLPVKILNLAEIAPPLDTSDITSFLGIQIVMEVFGQLEEKWKNHGNPR